MTILENKLREYNDDTNKPEFTGKSKGTKRSYDQMVEAAELDAEKSPQQKVTSDNAHSIVNYFVQRFNSIMEYAQKHDLTLKDAVTQFDQENQENLDRLLALQLQSQEVAKRLRRDTTTPEKEPTTEKSSDQQAPPYTVVKKEKLSDLNARAKARKTNFDNDEGVS